VNFDNIQTASVIRYPYLWSHEAMGGETESRKNRPVAVGARISRPKGADLIVLFPITTKEPRPDRFFVEIPDMEKHRSGLDVTKRLWIVFDDYNSDIIGQSYYLEPNPPLGRFSKAFFLPLMRKFIARKRQSAGVDRNQ